jgi:hypothetical protein
LQPSEFDESVVNLYAISIQERQVSNAGT